MLAWCEWGRGWGEANDKKHAHKRTKRGECKCSCQSGNFWVKLIEPDIPEHSKHDIENMIIHFNLWLFIHSSLLHMFVVTDNVYNTYTHMDRQQQLCIHERTNKTKNLTLSIWIELNEMNQASKWIDKRTNRSSKWTAVVREKKWNRRNKCVAHFNTPVLVLYCMNIWLFIFGLLLMHTIRIERDFILRNLYTY